MFHGLPAGALARFRRCNDPVRSFATAPLPLEANTIKRGGWRGAAGGGSLGADTFLTHNNRRGVGVTTRLC